MNKEDHTMQQQMSNDLSYLRGRFDTVIPLIETGITNINTIITAHENKIAAMLIVQENQKVKVSLMGATAGVLLSAVVNFLFKKF